MKHGTYPRWMTVLTWSILGLIWLLGCSDQPGYEAASLSAAWFNFGERTGLVSRGVTAAKPKPSPAPGSPARIYTTDQNSNTVTVIDPATDAVLGTLPLGKPRPGIFGARYYGEINVHGIGFSPDGQTIAVVSVGSNAVTFIDTSTYQVKGTVYVGRAPHEAFYRPDGKEVWVAVRGQDYVSVIDATTLREVRRIQTVSNPSKRIGTSRKLPP